MDPRSRSSVLEPGSLCLGRQLVNHLPPLGFVLVLVADEILESHPAPSSDYPARDALPEQLHGRDTFRRSTACWVVSSAWTGTMVTALPFATSPRMRTKSSNARRSAKRRPLESRRSREVRCRIRRACLPIAGRGASCPRTAFPASWRPRAAQSGSGQLSRGCRRHLVTPPEASSSGSRTRSGHSLSKRRAHRATSSTIHSTSSGLGVIDSASWSHWNPASPVVARAR